MKCPSVGKINISTTRGKMGLVRSLSCNIGEGVSNRKIYIYIYIYI